MADILTHPAWPAQLAALGIDCVVVWGNALSQNYDVIVDRPSLLVPGQDSWRRLKFIGTYNSPEEAIEQGETVAAITNLPLHDYSHLISGGAA